MQPRKRKLLTLIALVLVAALVVVVIFSSNSSNIRPAESDIPQSDASLETKQKGFKLAIDSSGRPELTGFTVPAFGVSELVQRDASCRVPFASGDWKMKAYADKSARLVGLEYVKPGASRPPVDTEFAKENYRIRGERVLGLADLDINPVLPKVFNELVHYIQPDEVRFLKLTSVVLTHRTGTRVDEGPKKEKVIVLVVYAPNALPGVTSRDDDAARYVYSSDGELKWMDNVLGGE